LKPFSPDETFGALEINGDAAGAEVFFHLVDGVVFKVGD
jgi:hypothetical protein